MFFCTEEDESWKPCLLEAIEGRDHRVVLVRRLREHG